MSDPDPLAYYKIHGNIITKKELCGIRKDITFRYKWIISDFLQLPQHSRVWYKCPRACYIGENAYSLQFLLKVSNAGENPNAFLGIEIPPLIRSYSITIAYSAEYSNEIVSETAFSTVKFAKRKAKEEPSFLSLPLQIDREYLEERMNRIGSDKNLCITWYIATKELDEPATSCEILIRSKSEQGVRDPNLYLNEDHADCRIKVGDRLFPFKKEWLTEKSKYFDRLSPSVAEGHDKPEYEIEDCHPEEVELFLRFICFGVLEHPSDPHALCTLYRLAIMYDVDDLKDACLENFKSNMSLDILFRAIELADLLENTDKKEPADLLWEYASSFIAVHCISILRSNHWVSFETEKHHLALKVLKIILTRNEFKSNT